jgi:hypothetical protein
MLAHHASVRAHVHVWCALTAAGARPEPIRLRPSNGEAKAVGGRSTGIQPAGGEAPVRHSGSSSLTAMVARPGLWASALLWTKLPVKRPFPIGWREVLACFRLEMAASGRVGRWAKFMLALSSRFLPLAGRGRRRPFAVQVFKWVYVEPLRARIAVKDPAALVHRDRSLRRTASLPAPLAGCWSKALQEKPLLGSLDIRSRL